MKWIKNPHVHYPVLVPCGKCPACQQEKANKRTQRIKSNCKVGNIALFITLTYADSCLPYVLRDDLIQYKKFVPIYRNSKVRRVRVGSDYTQAVRRSHQFEVLDEVFVDSEFYNDFDINSFKPVCVFNRGSRTKKYDNSRISVCYYKDIQSFYKRLRQNLLRVYNYEKSFSFFSCSEIGPVSGRAHFHGLVFIPAEDEQLFRSAIRQSWPFNDWISAKDIQVAKKAASYVSSYVNRGSDFPRFFTHNAFRPKHSYSKGFGLSDEHFSLSKILEKIDNGDLHYPIATVRESVPVVTNILVPKYVINRYFPKFKGFAKLTTAQTRELLSCPASIKRYARYLDYSQSDIHKFIVSLRNSVHRFCDALNVSFDVGLSKYIHYYPRAWIVRNSTILKDWYMDSEVPLVYKYDNLIDMLNRVDNEHLQLELERMFFTDGFVDFDKFNPNKNPYRIRKTQFLEELFYKKDKSRKVSNTVMTSTQYYNCV